MLSRLTARRKARSRWMPAKASRLTSLLHPRVRRFRKLLPAQLLAQRRRVVVVGLVDDLAVLDPHEAHAMEPDPLVLRGNAHPSAGVGAGEGPFVGDAVAGGDGLAAQ